MCSGHEIAGGFQRIPNKRVIPDYFDVIKEPIAFSTIRVWVVPIALSLNRRTTTDTKHNRAKS